jgi:hypothetical protein
MTMIEATANDATDIREVRESIRESLRHRDHDEPHSTEVATVVHELLVAAFERGRSGTVVVRVEDFPLLTSIRLHSTQMFDLRDGPFDLRERVLTALTIAFGTRANPDGGVDLWAEVPRPAR